MMKKEDRPRIQPELTMPDRALQVLAIAGAVGLLVSLVIAPSVLPDRVPLHFGVDGQPDRWGSSWELLLVPVIALGLYALLSFVARIPHHYNYPFAITAQNAERQYSLARRLVFALRAVLAWVFLVLFLRTYQVAIGTAPGLGALSLFLSVGLIGACIVWYFIAASRAR